ncbi:putative cytochrome P450 [Meredithblackwellia eburnea MCA 4105]
MPSSSQISLTLILGLISYLIYKLILKPRFSPLSDLPGPPSDSLFFGNYPSLLDSEPGVTYLKWSREYGGAVRYSSLLGGDGIFFTDPVALNHILLTNAYDFPKPPEVRGELSRILGKGILFAEGQDHKRQKRILGPAFSPGAVKDLAPIFFEQAYKLRDIWIGLINSGKAEQEAFKNDSELKSYEGKKGEGETAIEVSKWFSKLTLDIIGLAGFGYNFHSLDLASNALGEALGGMMSRNVRKPTPFKLVIFHMLGFLVNALPYLQGLPIPILQSVKRGFETMDRETKKIVVEKKRELKEGGASGQGEGGKDLISVLLKANQGDAKSQLSDEELQGQMTTFCLAGHETTSTALSWAAWNLSTYPDVQAKLRKEIREAREKAKAEGREELDADELNNLEYLDAYCRELLRFDSPVAFTIRSSAKDALIPLSTPITGKSGSTITSVPLRAGQVIYVSVRAVNFSKDIFGDDVDIFRPERWMENKKIGGETTGVGVWSHLLTFLAGPRACIGYRFSLLELKVILSVLVDSFFFAPRDDEMKILRGRSLVVRPVVIGEEELGHALPLRVSITG